MPWKYYLTYINKILLMLLQTSASPADDNCLAYWKRALWNSLKIHMYNTQYKVCLNRTQISIFQRNNLNMKYVCT